MRALGRLSFCSALIVHCVSAWSKEKDVQIKFNQEVASAVASKFISSQWRETAGGEAASANNSPGKVYDFAKPTFRSVIAKDCKGISRKLVVVGYPIRTGVGSTAAQLIVTGSSKFRPLTSVQSVSSVEETLNDQTEIICGES